jgi:hypothetical protein
MRQLAWVPGGATPTAIHRIATRTDPTENSGERMPVAALLVVDEADDGIYLLRYAANGEFAGDSWHQSIEDARHQARFEYGPLTWTEAPDGPTRVDDFAKTCLAGRSRSDG